MCLYKKCQKNLIKERHCFKFWEAKTLLMLHQQPYLKCIIKYKINCTRYDSDDNVIKSLEYANKNQQHKPTTSLKCQNRTSDTVNEQQ